MDKSFYPTVSSAVLLDLYDGLTELRLISCGDKEFLGFSRQDLLDIEKRFSARDVERLWALAKDRGASPHIGLLIGSRLNGEAKGILSNLVQSAKNLREAILLFEEHIRVMSEIEDIHLEPDLEGLKIIYDFKEEKYYHEASISRSMSASVAWACYLTGEPIRPLEVGFRLKNVANRNIYDKTFGVKCKFGTTQDYLVVSPEDLERPIATSNEFVKQLLLEKIDDVKYTLDKAGYFTRIVREIVEKNLHRGVVSSEFVASELNISRPTLHRRLSSEGFTFGSLVSEVRKEIAEYHLERRCCKLEELSEMLGFSEPSAFFKAFKAWFNTTPRRFKPN